MEIIAQSDTGIVRQNNEDAMAYDAELAVAVLADGMGGLEAGEVASGVAVNAIVEQLRQTPERSEQALAGAVAGANAAVREAAREAKVEMGTTVVAWLLTDQGQCFVAHVGDSRVYRLRGDTLRCLTSDHSMVQQMVDDGVLSQAEALTSPHRNVITRALGLEDRIKVDVRSWVYAVGDIYLLCSDGLTDMVTEEEIGRTVARVLDGGAGSLAELAQALIGQANEAGGYDNISVLLIRPD